MKEQISYDAVHGWEITLCHDGEWYCVPFYCVERMGAELKGIVDGLDVYEDLDNMHKIMKPLLVQQMHRLKAFKLH